MISIISAEDNPYQIWQLKLLSYTHQRVGQSGPLVFLLATPNKESSLDLGNHSQVIPSRLLSKHPVTGDFYPPYNKPASLLDYLSSVPPSDHIYLLLDPDMIFVSSWDPDLIKDRPIGEDTLYMNPYKDPGPFLIPRYCRRNHHLVQPLGFPIVIHDHLLRDIVDRWYLLTENMRSDVSTRSKAGWVSEMWAFTIACAEAGLVFQVQRNCSFSHDRQLNRPLIHYTYQTKSPSGYLWNKRNYTPWNSLPKLRHDVPESGKILHHILEEYIKKIKFEGLI